MSNEKKEPTWAQVTKVIDERTLESRAHERGMVAYSAYMAMSEFKEVKVDFAEKVYREAYDLAMGRES